MSGKSCFVHVPPIRNFTKPSRVKPVIPWEASPNTSILCAEPGSHPLLPGREHVQQNPRAETQRLSVGDPHRPRPAASVWTTSPTLLPPQLAPRIRGKGRWGMGVGRKSLCCFLTWLVLFATLSAVQCPLSQQHASSKCHLLFI